MKKSRFSDEQIVAALRDAEATTVVAAARKHGVSEQSIQFPRLGVIRLRYYCNSRR